MELQTSQIIEVLQLKNGKYIICLILVAPRKIFYYKNQKEAHLNHRWLREEDWSAFDNAIEHMVNDESIVGNNFERNVELSPMVFMKTQTINSNIDYLCKGAFDSKDLNPKDVEIVFKCEIRYDQKVKENDDYINDDSNENQHLIDDDSNKQNFIEENNQLHRKDSHDIDVDNLNEKIKVIHVDNANNHLETDSTGIENTVSPTARRTTRTIAKPKRFEDFFIQTKRNQGPKTPIESSGENIPKTPQRNRIEEFFIPTKRYRSPKSELDSIEEISKTPQCNHASKTSVKSKTVDRNYKTSRTMTPKTSSRALFVGSKKNRNRIKEYNKNMEDLIKELLPYSPPKVPMLTLNDMSIDQVMKALDDVKPRLDSLFQEICNQNYVKKHDGINHFLVIELISEKTKRAMMEKLSEFYETEEMPMYGSHFLNVLVPEWILSIFIKRYQMERDEAIQHLKAQNSHGKNIEI